MRAKLPMLLVFVGLACSAQPPKAREARTAAHEVVKPEPSPLRGKPAAPAETLAAADHAYQLQLGASRGQFDVDWQVAMLNEAILLYTQFLERAEGRPELEPAVRKSRERIADAKATIVFLQPKAGAQPPAADSN